MNFNFNWNSTHPLWRRQYVENLSWQLANGMLVNTGGFSLVGVTF
jgi:hypothetical protein